MSTSERRIATERLTRAALLRRAGATAAAAAVAGAAAPYAFAGPLRFKGRWLAEDLSIVQWTHFVPGYNAWLREWARTWGEEHDVEVTIDFETYTRLPALAAAEVKKQRGHDIFSFLSPPALYEDEVIDHSAIVEQIAYEAGPYGTLGRHSTYNPRTDKYFGVSDYHVPAPVIWRHSLWESVGESPATWDHVLSAAPKLNALGHPIGIGLSLEPDSNTALISFLQCFGAFIQDDSNALTINSKRTIEAVEFMAQLYKAAGLPDVLAWKPESNNQFVLGGRGSLIVNAISAIRRAEDLQIPFAKDLWLWPIPGGPGGRSAIGQYTSVRSIWRFAKNPKAAERFLVDLCISSEEAVLESRFFNYPTFPGAVDTQKMKEAAGADPYPPKGKYWILNTIASKYTRNVGYPGYANAAVQEVLDAYLIPRMFAGVALERMSASDSVRATAKQMKRIWAKWRRAGKV